MPSPASNALGADPAADVLLAVLGPALAFVAAWLVLSVALTLLAAALGGRRPGLARLLRSLALPPVRRLVERTVAVSVAVSLASAGVSSPPAASAGRGGGAGGVGDPSTALEEPVVRGEGGGAAPPTIAPPAPDPSPRSPERTGGTGHDAPGARGVHVVSPGENLWSISEQVLTQHASATGPVAVDEPDVARYWARLIDLNRTTLRSGDPDLVFPGEQLTLPPVSENAPHPRRAAPSTRR